METLITTVPDYCQRRSNDMQHIAQRAFQPTAILAVIRFQVFNHRVDVLSSTLLIFAAHMSYAACLLNPLIVQSHL